MKKNTRDLVLAAKFNLFMAFVAMVASWFTDAIQVHILFGVFLVIANTCAVGVEIIKSNNRKDNA